MLGSRRFAYPRWLSRYVVSVFLLLASGCSTTGAIVGGVIGTTVVGAHSPTQEIEQVYYLGVFDPQEQVPPTIYRVTVRGQASFISGVKFGSGWVPAKVIDSLNSHVGFDVNDDTAKTANIQGGEGFSGLKTGRRLVMFGPEGFREAPKDHRLVIVMGSSPKNFFQAIDTSLRAVANVERERFDGEVGKLLFREMARIKSERDRLQQIELDIRTDLSEAK